ncbi:hypothetical protein M8C21_032640, partial [Ambrosia artemisiifolia]
MLSFKGLGLKSMECIQLLMFHRLAFQESRYARDSKFLRINVSNSTLLGAFLTELVSDSPLTQISNVEFLGNFERVPQEWMRYDKSHIPTKEQRVERFGFSSVHFVLV